MNTLVENLTGMNTLTDQVIAYDFLIGAKSGVRSYAMALTEAATPEVRAILRKQLEESITTHEQITAYTMKKGWYHAYNIQEQIKLDLQNAQIALQLAK
jgi:similar to spore coat protein